MKAQIKIKNLSVTYFKGRSNEVKAIHDINLEIFPGEFIIFYGPSGCGKSTLMYSIAGLERGIEGDVYINEKNIADMNTSEFEHYHQKEIGMVFQAYYLIPSLSVADNIMLPQIAIGAVPKYRKHIADDLMKHFGVYKQKRKSPLELSGGQQQRVAICRALINDPAIILADEPVGNLDSKSAQDVMGLLKQLNEKNKKTIILVTHDPTHLNIADRVFYMKDGEHQQTITNKMKHAAAIRKELPKTKEAAILEKTFGKLSDIQDNVSLEEYKARHIVLDALTGLSADEISGIEKRVDQLLLSGSGNYDPIFQYLDKNSKKGGIDIDTRTAKKITDDMGEMSKLVHTFHLQKTDLHEQRDNIFEYLTNKYKLKFKNDKAKVTMKKAITARLESDVDKEKFFEILDRPIRKNGVGLDIRIAHRTARRMELLMLGKYQLMHKPESKKLELIDRKE